MYIGNFRLITYDKMHTKLKQKTLFFFEKRTKKDFFSGTYLKLFFFFFFGDHQISAEKTVSILVKTFFVLKGGLNLMQV